MTDTPVTHEHIKDDIRSLRSLQLWTIMLGVTLIVGLGGVLVRQAWGLSTAIANQTALQERVAKEEAATTEQRAQLTATLQNMNQRLFELHRALQEGDDAVEASAQQMVERHFNHEHN